MKKTLKTILLCCIALIAVMTLGGCGGKGKYDDSISEMRDQFLKGENQRFTVTLIGGYRETPFEIDGVSGEKGEYSLISVTPKSATAYSAIKVILLDEEGKQEAEGEALKHPYKECFYFEIMSRVPDKQTVRLVYGDSQADIELTSVRGEGEIDGAAALDIALKALSDSLAPYRPKDKFSGEIYVRYIENPLKSDGKYYWYVAFVPAAQLDTSVAALLDASTGAVMATRK